MADLKVVELPTKTEPHPQDVKGIANWLHRLAESIEEGAYPHLERVLVIRYSPDGDEVFKMSSSGIRHINYIEAIGILELMTQKLKDDIRK